MAPEIYENFSPKDEKTLDTILLRWYIIEYGK
jgi:hypothetical protein